MFALTALLAAVVPAWAQPADTPFTAALGELPDAGFADKEAIITRLVETGHPSTGAVLTAMLEDRLYVRTSDRRVFITTSADDTQPAFSLLDPLTLKGAGSSPSGDLTKITTNNRLRQIWKRATGSLENDSVMFNKCQHFLPVHHAFRLSPPPA